MSLAPRPLVCALLCAAGLASAAPALAGAGRQVAVLPPPRPTALAAERPDRLPDPTTTGAIKLADDDAPVGGPETTRPGPAAAASPDKAPVGEKAILERANAALNSVTSMTADFSQTGGDGRQVTGILYLQRPGKLRFEYNKPSTMEVVSDGSTVLVRDRKLNTSDPYPISQTPLKFLLSAKIDLGRDVSVKKVATEPGGVAIAIEDTTTLGGTSRITLGFDADVTVLKRWRVIDPQGYTTSVSLSDIEKNRTIDPHIFMLNYMRPVE